jgi:hypothetical protein
MKVIICGSRTVTDYGLVAEIIHAVEQLLGYPFSEIVSGTASGVDSIGAKYGKSACIPVKEFPADWNKYGRRAGYLRNAEMVKYADALIAIWDGKSRGTKHAIDLAFHKGIPVYIFTVI